MAVSIVWGIMVKGNLCMLHTYVTICFHGFDLRMAEFTNTENWKGSLYSKCDWEFGNIRLLKVYLIQVLCTTLSIPTS